MKDSIYIFLDFHPSNIVILPYDEMMKELKYRSNCPLATYDVEFLDFKYNSYLVFQNKVVLHNQDILTDKSGLLVKEVRKTHNLPKLFRAGYLHYIIRDHYDNNTYGHMQDFLDDGLRD